MARRRTQRQFSPSPKRLTNWVGGVSTGLTGMVGLSAATALIVSSLDTRLAANASLGTDFTIVRIRGILSFIFADIAVDRASFGAFGVCVVNGEAFDAGVASIISPWTESGDDRWFYHMYWSSAQVVDVVGTDAGASSFVTREYQIDGKAMRKVNIGDVIVAVIEQASSATAINFIENHRTLIKLS